MVKKTCRRIGITLVLAAAGLLGGCGGGGSDAQGGGSTPPASTPATTSPTVALRISPSSEYAPQGATRQFNVVVTGATDTAVDWSVEDGSRGGSITSAGLYTAPMQAGEFRVVATLRADRRWTASAKVAVPEVFFNLADDTVVLGPGGMRDLYAQARIGTPTLQEPIEWTVVEGAAGGSIGELRHTLNYDGWRSEAAYTAPTTPGTYHVGARLRMAATFSDESTVTVVSRGFKPAAAADTGDQRQGHTSTLLADGQILNVGGAWCAPGVDPEWNVCELATAALFDVVSRRFAATGGLSDARAYHTATRLADGRVLVVGGDRTSGRIASAELYEPNNGRFVLTGPMSMPRVSHTATLLLDGRVLVIGGGTPGPKSGYEPTASAEIYDPRTGVFVATGSLRSPRSGHSATLLANGKVLVVGGYPINTPATNTAEIFDPVSGTFSDTGTSRWSRASHGATRLRSGAVLIAGGLQQTSAQRPPNVIEIYRPETGRFEEAGVMIRSLFTRTPPVELPNGTVLIANGAVAELFDPATGSSTEVGGTRYYRGADAIVLADGRVLFAGSGEGAAAAEIFE